MAKIFLLRAKLFREIEDLEQAIDWLRKTHQEIDRAQEPRLFAAAMAILGRTGRFAEALDLLPEVQQFFSENAPLLDRVRLRWTEGNIAFDLGRLDEA